MHEDDTLTIVTRHPKLKANSACGMIQEYCKGFKLLFSNRAVIWMLLGASFRIY